MPVETPFFSIVIPVYNRAQLIGNTLLSLARQTHKDFEAIIVDDGSSDDTAAVIRQLDLPFVRYFYKENGERGAARNYGWSKAKGCYVSFLDSDDLVYPHHLANARTFLESKPNVMAYAQAYEIREAGTNKRIGPGYHSRGTTINNALLRGNFLSCFGVFVHRSVFPGLCFEEHRSFAGTEDWLLWLRIAARFPFYYHNEVTGSLLQHDQRSVLSFNEESLAFRAAHLRSALESDVCFAKVFGVGAIGNVYAHMLSYAALHLAMVRHRKRAGAYLLRAIARDSSILVSRRMAAILRLLVTS